MTSPENSNWLFDYGLLEDIPVAGGDLPSLEQPGFNWPPHGFNDSTGLRYVTSDDVLELKGKVACEISSADELTLTELMFNGVLKDIKVEEMVSLLSCFVWQEKLTDTQKPRDELELIFTQLQDTARRVAKVQLECKAEKNELRDEKQMLKAEKDVIIEMRVKALSTPPGFLPHPPAMPNPFVAQCQVVGGKLMSSLV